jgi:antitoxin component YwqK of YwqJK toxin-antitoxin module
LLPLIPLAVPKMNVRRIVKKGNYKDVNYPYNYHDCNFEYHHYEYSLIKGKIHGAFYVYYPSGQLKWKKNYKNGIEEGLQLAWHENSMPSMRFTKKNGEFVGDFYDYADNGTLILKEYVDEDTLLYEKKSYAWFHTGEIKQEVEYSYVDGDRIVHLKNYHKNGRLAMESHYNSTKRVKNFQKWDEAGVPIPTEA